MAIKIKASHRGLFTRKAKAQGMSDAAYARKIMAAPKGRYSTKTRKQASFVRSSRKWKH